VTLLVALAALQAACGSSSHESKSTPATTAAATTEAMPSQKPPLTTTPAATTGSTTTVAPATTTTAGPTATTQVVQQSLCPSEQGAGILANFGHRRTSAAADALVTHASTFGFRGLRVQRRACHDFAVVLPGLKTVRQARELQREARTVGLKVTIDCRSQPLLGGLAGVFGHRATRRAARKLLREAAHVGFRNLQVQQDACNDWEVDLHGIQTQGQQQELTKEAARVGFHLTFEPG
jgi:hypothetical protein